MPHLFSTTVPRALVLLFALVSISGCGSGDSPAGSSASDGGPPKPKLVGKWSGDIGSGVKMELTVNRNGEFLGANIFTGNPSVMFVVSAVEGETVILRHISEANDDNAKEGKIEFQDADTIELWPPSGLQALKETSYIFKRVPGSAPQLGPPLQLPSEAKPVVGTWETQAQGQTILMDLLPDGTMFYTVMNYPASEAQWRYKETSGKTILIETGKSEETMGVARITFQSDNKMTMTEDDGTNSMTFTRVDRLIE